MNKRFLSTLMTGVAALVVGGVAFAADQSQGSQQDSVQQNPAAQPAEGAGSPGAQRDVMKEKDAYFAAMSKCDALTGVAEKQQCVDSVRKQYGQM